MDYLDYFHEYLQHQPHVHTHKGNPSNVFDDQFLGHVFLNECRNAEEDANIFMSYSSSSDVFATKLVLTRGVIFS